MSVSHVLKRKLQIRVHRTWSTDHNGNQTIKNWSNYIEVMGIFHEFLPKPLHSVGQTFAAFEAFPLFVLLCWRVGAWYKISLPEHQFSFSSPACSEGCDEDVHQSTRSFREDHEPFWVQGQGDESELLMFELRRMLRMSARYVTKWDCTVVMARFHKIQIHMSQRYLNIKVSAVHRYRHIVQVETHKGRTLYLYELETRDCWATRSWRGSSAKSSQMRNDQSWITCTAHHSTVHFRIR